MRSVNRAPCWNSTPMRLRRDCRPSWLTLPTSVPKAWTEPRWATIWPVAARSSVVLPDPEPPITATTCPACTCMEMPSSTVKSP
ncbi:Uncharacterised protein [Bordetella pertussis]|nr:Uncharacterised protein [Bordetella pertussis]